jgi:hypothetical protein
MERIHALIAKLREQADKQADVAQMLTTLQLIRDELTSLPHSGSYEQPAEPYNPAPRTLGTSKVAVVLPSTLKADPAYEKYAPKPAAIVEEPVVQEVKETVLVQKGSVSIVQENGQLDMVFDPMTEIPTLSHQVQSRAKNGEPESLNDRLRQSKTELIEVLKETPVKDLRKAIGINDRFLFINDLFRGDESMYERSIKTINGFNIFPEAEYWINRELKVKLGWKADDPAVVHFDQLIKRRFS